MRKILRETLCCVGIILVFGEFLSASTLTMVDKPSQATESSSQKRLWKVSNTQELKKAISEIKRTEEIPDLFYLPILSSGITIVLEPGLYVMEETVEFKNLAQINIVGSGWNTIWEKRGDGNAIVFTESPFCTVKNLKLIGDLNSKTGSGIVFRSISSSYAVVDYCRIQRFARSGLRFEATAQLPMSSCTVSNCNFIGNRGHQLYGFYSNDFYIIGNQFGSHENKLPKTGAFLDHCSAGTYMTNYHWDNVVAFRMIGSHYNRIENNRFEMSQKEGVIIGEPNIQDKSSFNIFIGNTIHTNSRGNWKYDPDDRKESFGKYVDFVAYDAVNTTFCNNQIFSWNTENYMSKRCFDISNRCNKWIVTGNIFGASVEKPVIMYDKNAGHIVKDNIIN